jgi:hypothetical protein
VQLPLGVRSTRFRDTSPWRCPSRETVLLSLSEDRLSCFDEFLRALGADTLGRAKALALHEVIFFEKRFNFIKHPRIDLLQIFDVPVQLCVGSDSDQTVVSKPLLAVIGLLRFDRSDDARPDDTACRSGVVE